MKRLTIPCDFAGVKAPFHVYLGQPNPLFHPVHFQQAWLNEHRGGVFPAGVADSLQQLATIAAEKNVSFEDLAVWALGLATETRPDSESAS